MEFSSGIRYLHYMNYLKVILTGLGFTLLGLSFWLFLPGGARSAAIRVSSENTGRPADESADTSSPVCLISGGEAADALWTSRTPAAKRARKILIDPAWMTPDPVLKAGDRIVLALFDDVEFEAEIGRVTQYVNGAVGLTAQLQGERGGTAYLSYSDGKLLASIEVNDGAGYAIRCLDGVHYALEVDRAASDVLDGGDSLVSPATSDAVVDGVAAASVTTADASVNAPVGSTVIDVMIVYTPAALSYEGSEANMNNNIVLAMEKANLVHENSGTDVYFNLVHSAQVNYTENASSENDLNALTDVDGVMDEVLDWRDLYCADLVCLFESTEDTGGLSWILNSVGGSSGYAFCLARVQQSDWTFTVIHELGHTMGCHHAKGQVNQPGPGLFNYSAGWQWSDSSTAPYGKCTVMTYEKYYGGNEVAYTRVPYFSNPEINYVGTSTSTGDAADGDNAQTIRKVSSVIANYRDAPDLDYDGLPNEWELQYFGSETGADPDAVASNGVNSVRQAYIAGLDPTDAGSVFKILSQQSTASGFVVRWTPAAGRSYSISRATDLFENFLPVQTNILWPQSGWTDTVQQTEGFYQIDVQLQE